LCLTAAFGYYGSLPLIRLSKTPYVPVKLMMLLFDALDRLYMFIDRHPPVYLLLQISTVCILDVMRCFRPDETSEFIPTWMRQATIGLFPLLSSMEIAVTVPYFNWDFFRKVMFRDNNPKCFNSLMNYIVVALLVCPLDIFESIHIQQGVLCLFFMTACSVVLITQICPVKTCIIMRSFWNIKHAAYIDRNNPYIGLVLMVMLLLMLLPLLWWKMPYHAIEQKKLCKKHKPTKKLSKFAQYTFIVCFFAVCVVCTSIIVQHLLDQMYQASTAPFNVTTLVRAVSNLTRNELMVDVLKFPLVSNTLNLCKLFLVVMYTTWSYFFCVSTHNSIANKA
jgi:hypothetical protein